MVLWVYVVVHGGYLGLILVTPAAALVVFPFRGVGGGSKPTIEAGEWA